jgi:cell cycle checkpoint protein
MHGFQQMSVPLIIQTVIFKPQSAALKEAIDDLEWPGSSIQIMLQPVPPSVTFKGEGHGDLQVRFSV